MSKILINHEERIRREQRHTMITFRGEEIHRITKTVEYISTHQQWIFDNYKDADNLTKHILSINNAIKYVLGQRSDEITLGTCPTFSDDGQTCGAVLRVNVKIIETYGDIICRRCKTTWTSEHWRLLGRVLENENEI